MSCITAVGGGEGVLHNSSGEERVSCITAVGRRGCLA